MKYLKEFDKFQINFNEMSDNLTTTDSNSTIATCSNSSSSNTSEFKNHNNYLRLAPTRQANRLLLQRSSNISTNSSVQKIKVFLNIF